MNTSPETNEINAALAAFQAEMPVVPKNHKAKIPTKSGGEFEYDYADLADVIEAAKPHKAENGLGIVQPPETMVILNDDGRQTIMHALTTRLTHSSGQWMEGTMYVPHVGDLRALGSSLTYCRRYAQCAILGIVSDVDEDGALAVAAYGEDSKRGRRQNAPRSATSTRGTGGKSKVSAQDPATAGEKALPAKDRNKIIAHLARLDPPVRGDEVAKKLGVMLGLDGPIEPAKLNDSQGAALIAALGIK